MPARTHGLSASADYKLWQQMKIRCYNPRAQRYTTYGGRGISVCDRWRYSFENFINDMGPRPSAGHSLDRIDTNGNYTPENCRWVTKHEQSHNKRNNRRITHNGETLSLAEWNERAGLGYATLFMRLKAGWPMEQALCQKPLAHPITHNGETCSVSEWARRCGLSVSGLRQRLSRGWPVELALTTPPDKPRDRTGRYIQKHISNSVLT